MHKFNHEVSFTSQVSQLCTYLSCNEITVSSIASKFLSMKGNILGAAGSDVPWIKYWYPDEMSEEHIISAGMAELKFSDDILLVPLERAVRMIVACRRHISGFPMMGTESIQDIQGYLTGQFQNTINPTILLPVCSNSHWGVVVPLKESESVGAIYWGDSLRVAPATGLLEGIRRLLVEVSQNVAWIIKNENYTLDILKYPPQEDNFSCGFYMLSTMATFAECSGSIRCFSKEEGPFSINNLAAAVQNIRLGCIKAFLESVDVIGKNQARFSDVDVLLYLQNKIISRGYKLGKISTNNADDFTSTQKEHGNDRTPPVVCVNNKTSCESAEDACA